MLLVADEGSGYDGSHKEEVDQDVKAKEADGIFKFLQEVPSLEVRGCVKELQKKITQQVIDIK